VTDKERYGIPAAFDEGTRMGDYILFSFCDHLIKINTRTGEGTESWMGLNADATEHRFITRPFQPEVQR
jgi:hypothetical protein